MAVSAKVIKDSLWHGSRLTTMEIELHRFILPEFNTHRKFSRNFQSSRAIPVERQIEMVKQDTAFPVYWGKNQAGMTAKEEIEGLALDVSKRNWELARNNACISAMSLHLAGVHKQIVNRLIEPFMFTKGVVTGTQDAFYNFFTLRCHKDAQPEIQALAFKMREAYLNSVPQKLLEGQAHLPYVDSTEGTTDNFQLSASCCAQVSYRRLDDSPEKTEKVYGMLNLDNMTDEVFERDMSDEIDPAHASPCEHQAIAAITGAKPGNFTGPWVQHRKALGG